MSRRLLARTVPAVLALLLGATACGGDDDAPTGGVHDGVVEISIQDGEVSPAGERVQAEVGEPVTLEITADTAGELHVHSTPEQTVPFEAGTSTHEVTVDQPGVVEVESHDPEVVIVQLEVR